MKLFVLEVSWFVLLCFSFLCVITIIFLFVSVSVFNTFLVCVAISTAIILTLSRSVQVSDANIAIIDALGGVATHGTDEIGVTVYMATESEKSNCGLFDSRASIKVCQYICVWLCLLYYFDVILCFCCVLPTIDTRYR